MKVNWTKLRHKRALGLIDNKFVEIKSYINDKDNICTVQVVVARNSYKHELNSKDFVERNYEVDINLQEILTDFPSFFNEMIESSINKYNERMGARRWTV